MSATPKKTSSSPYQILGNRPIDQWKVTELKEELKRRRLTTKGLKDDLVKRLDEALRIERDSAREEAEANLNGADDAQVQDKGDGATTPEKGLGGSDKDFETPQKIEDREIERTDDDWVKVNAGDCLPVAGEQNNEAVSLASGMVSGEETVTVVQTTVVETTTETVVSETSLSVQEIENESVKSEAGNDDIKSQIENALSKSEIGMEESEGSRHQNDSEKPVQVDHMRNSQDLGSEGKDGGTIKSLVKDDDVPISGQEDAPFPTNQVSEVSPALGLAVKSDSISSDSVSIVEKNDLEDKIISDNLKFKLNVKPEMVKPSSMNVAPDAGGSHPMDVEDSLEKNLSLKEKDGNATKNSADAEDSEKLNLDRSSGDDSMDEDVFDNKQMDTKNVSNAYEDKNEQIVVEIKDEIVIDVVSEAKDDSHIDDKVVVAAAEKRKLPGQQSTGNNEPVKRQRRWNAETVKVTEPKITAATISTTTKENISPAVEKSNSFRSDTLNSEETTKERVVPPSVNPATNSLRIDRFLRPFTLKAVQELLGKTGKVVSFWMDHIKTHCYVTYSSVEEAIETRNAVYNLQWPTNGGRLLVADFVDPQEVKNRVEAPTPSPAAPVSAPTPQAAAPIKLPQSSPRQVQRQQPPVPTSVHPTPQLSAPPPAREAPPVSMTGKVDPPIVTLDDLFRKTTTLPRIYYLPLSEEQVANKIAARGKNIKA